jgi:hypothetical protein
VRSKITGVPRTSSLGTSCAAAAGLFAVASDAFGTASYADCDNLAGGCLRKRQQLALQALGAAAALVGIACMWAAARSLVRPARWQILALVCGVAIVVAVQVVAPVDHLDNRWSGWLSDPLDK